MPKMPKMPKMPDMTGVKKLLPGTDDTLSADDPRVPFNAGDRLARGHTLRLRIYEGAMKTREIFSGLTLIDDQGVAQIGKIGSAKIGGRTLVDAEKMIQSVCRISGGAALQIHVHIISVENVQLVSVTGDVKTPQYLQIWDGMRFVAAVNQSGGRKTSSGGAAVYLTRDGVRKFFSYIGALDEWGTPEPGDIITLSGDL
jgi:protein involved in polysaccharide export with SLBB domain